VGSPGVGLDRADKFVVVLTTGNMAAVAGEFAASALSLRVHAPDATEAPQVQRNNGARRGVSDTAG